MKKYFYLFAMMLLTATAFTSCSDDDENEINSDDLIGIWQGVTSDGWNKKDGKIYDEWENEPIEDDLIVVTPNDEFMQYEYNQRYKYWECIGSGEYTLKNKKIYVEVDGESVHLGTVKKLTSNTLVLEVGEKYKDNGVTYEYKEIATFRRADDIEL